MEEKLIRPVFLSCGLFGELPDDEKKKILSILYGLPFESHDMMEKREKRGGDMKGRRKIIVILCTVIFVAALLGAGCVYEISWWVEKEAKDRIFTEEEAKAFEADCILVLGAGILENGTPSLMLRGRPG